MARCGPDASRRHVSARAFVERLRVVIFLGARWAWNRGSRTTAKALPQYDETRIERIENAVDAIAIEVERISEAQRFTVGLLSDRLPARPVERVAELPLPSKRANTPH